MTRFRANIVWIKTLRSSTVYILLQELDVMQICALNLTLKYKL